MSPRTCHECKHLKAVAVLLPGGTESVCRNPRWDGYVNPERPTCEIMRNGRRVLAGFEVKGDDA